MLSHIAALTTMIVWGFTFVCTKVLLDYMSPLDILLSRTVLGFAALCLLRPNILKLADKRHEALFALAGFTGSFCYYLAENTALAYADASFVSVAVSTAPLFTAALGFTILKEPGFGPRFVAGFAIAILGIALISFQEGPAHVTALGAALCLVGAVAWAVYSIVVKKLANAGYETVAMTKRMFAWGLVFMVITRLVTGGSYPVESLGQPVVWGNLAFLGLLASAGCFITWNFSVKHLGATATSAYIYLQVPISVIAAVVLLGDLMTWSIALGIALVLVGLILSEDFGRMLVQRVWKKERGDAE